MKRRRSGVRRKLARAANKLIWDACHFSAHTLALALLAHFLAYWRDLQPEAAHQLGSLASEHCPWGVNEVAN